MTPYSVTLITTHFSMMRMTAMLHAFLVTRDEMTAQCSQQILLTLARLIVLIINYCKNQ